MRKFSILQLDANALSKLDNEFCHSTTTNDKWRSKQNISKGSWQVQFAISVFTCGHCFELFCTMHENAVLFFCTLETHWKKFFHPSNGATWCFRLHFLTDMHAWVMLAINASSAVIFNCKLRILKAEARWEHEDDLRWSAFLLHQRGTIIWLCITIISIDFEWMDSEHVWDYKNSVQNMYHGLMPISRILTFHVVQSLKRQGCAPSVCWYGIVVEMEICNKVEVLAAVWSWFFKRKDAAFFAVEGWIFLGVKARWPRASWQR